jgi:hypothetical protein
MINDMEYFVNSKEAFEEAESTIIYGFSYILPGGPTYHLIREYFLLPKGERRKAVTIPGWIGTGALTAKILLAVTGISFATFLGPCNKEELKKSKIEITDDVKYQKVNLERTIGMEESSSQQ